MAFFKKKQEDLFPPIPNMPDMQGMPNFPMDASMQMGAGLPPPPMFGQQQNFPQAPPAFQQQMQMPSAPAPPPEPVHREESPQGPSPLTLIKEDLEEISEAVIAEKWKGVEEKIEKIEKQQEEVQSKLSEIEDEIKNFEAKLNSLQSAVFGKIEEYSKGISDVNIEMQAMQKLFSNALPTFTQNLKDLQDTLAQARQAKKK